MSVERPGRGGGDAAAQDLLVAALRERGGRATAADLAVATGLPLAELEPPLRELLHTYESHLEVDENGQLLYLFDPGMQTRIRPETPAERRRRLRRRAGDVCWRGVQGLGVLLLVVYGWLYGLIVVVALLAMGGSRGEFRHKLRRFVLAQRNRARRKRGQDPVRDQLAMPWDRSADAAPVGAPIWPRIRALADRFRRLAWGPEDVGDGDGDEARERRLLSFLRAQRGVAVAADVVRLFGCSLVEADRLLTHLLVRHLGDVDVDDDGTMRFRFDQLLTSADADGGVRADATGAPGGFVWERWPLPDERPVRDGQDLLLAALGGLNVVVALGLLVALPYLGFARPLADLALVWFPLAYTALVTALAWGRWRAYRRRRPRRAARWARGRLLRLVTEEGRALPVDNPSVLTAALGAEAAEAAQIPPELLAAALQGLVDDLEGELSEVADGASLVATFPSVRLQLRAAEAARRARADGPGRLGRIVYSTRDDEAPD